MAQVEGRNPVLETLKRGGIRKLLVLEVSKIDPKVKLIVDLAKRRGAPVEFVER